MRRHFGLTATSTAEREGSIRVSDAAPIAVALAPAASNIPPDNSAELKLSSLPFAPASWRGCHGRRSVSAE